MPVKIASITRADAALIMPKDTSVVSYETLIREVEAQMSANKLFATSSSFKPGLSGNLMEMTWEFVDNSFIKIVASYNKNMRTKICSGFVDKEVYYVTNSDDASCRNHSEFTQTITAIFDSLETALARGIAYRDDLENVAITQERAAEIIGVVFIQEQFLTVTQVGNVHRNYFDKIPSNLNELFITIASVFTESHPTAVIDDYDCLLDFFRELKDNKPKELKHQTVISTTPIPTKRVSQVLNAEDYVSSIPSVIFL